MKFTFPDTVTNEIKKVKVQGEKNKLIPTGIGSMVNTFLLQHFDNIMDYGFTASVESQLDEIANGKIVWNIVVKDSLPSEFESEIDDVRRCNYNF